MHIGGESILFGLFDAAGGCKIAKDTAKEKRGGTSPFGQSVDSHGATTVGQSLEDIKIAPGVNHSQLEVLWSELAYCMKRNMPLT